MKISATTGLVTQCIECFNFKTMIVRQDGLKDLEFDNTKMIEQRLATLAEEGYTPELKIWFCSNKRKPVFTKKFAESLVEVDCPQRDI